jgi:hypothetical protein
MTFAIGHNIRVVRHGLRGPGGAKPLMARREALEAADFRFYPWDEPGLSCATPVTTFLRDLEIAGIVTGLVVSTERGVRRDRRFGRFVPQNPFPGTSSVDSHSE